MQEYFIIDGFFDVIGVFAGKTYEIYALFRA